MAGPPQNQKQWQRSSIGITPVTVRPRPGTRRIKKQDVVGTEIITKNAHPHALGGAGAAGGRREGGTEGAGRVCSVCARASADYSCPRCLIGYCSSNCYKVRCPSSSYIRFDSQQASVQHRNLDDRQLVECNHLFQWERADR